jgi:4-hydroxybenzoate polyprenyltransferase
MQFGGGEYGYVGNHSPDFLLLEGAVEAMVANPSLRLRLKMRLCRIDPVRTFSERAGSSRSVLKALRPHQWAKNLLVFLPLLLSHVICAGGLMSAVLAFCLFSLTASSAYILNDLFDIEADRRHPRKRQRPFAAGDLSACTGLLLVVLFLLFAFYGARLLPAAFFGWLLVYLLSTMAYSWYLKRIALVDVLVLSGLYTLRLLAGSAATGSHISHWLAGFSIFLYFSLAIVKRFAELENMRASNTQPCNGRGYLVADLSQLGSFGTASAFAAVMVFAIYISGSDVTKLYRRPWILWLIVPLLILWLCRVWLMASRGTLNEDPLVFAFTDLMSQCIGAAIAIIAWLAV